jgi:hypothetical protein
MISNSVRAVAMALMMGTAGIAVGSALTTSPAYAAGVRPAIGNALKEAESLAAAGRAAAAMDKVHEAEGVANKTPTESNAIEQVRSYVEAKSGQGPVGAKIKFANDYNAGRYRDVVGPDADALRKAGVLDGDSMRVIAQAYYLSGDKAECVRYIQNNFGGGGGEGILELQMRCAYDIGDDEAERGALEKLVASTNKAEYWAQLLKISERAKGLTDHQTLDIYRIKLLSNAMDGQDDYSLLAQLALQLGFPGEAQAVVQKGFDTKVLSGDRSTRLLNMAKTQAGQDAAGMARNAQAANAAKNGDALVKLGEDEWGNGKYPDAINAIKAGIAKGVSDPDNAQIRLGMAYLGAGQKDAAVHAFAAVKNDPRQMMIAHLWTLYARR